MTPRKKHPLALVGLALAYWLWVGAPIPGLESVSKPPFPSDVERVLIVRQAGAPLTPDQVVELEGPTLTESVGFGNFRVYNPGDDVSGEAQWVKDAVAAYNAKPVPPPAILIANKSSGFPAAPLPANDAALKVLIQKYAGK